MASSRSPYEGARVEELQEPLLPRWFVLVMVLAVPTAIGVVIWAFVAFGPTEVPVAQRRPPPSEGSTLTTDVGLLNVGTLADEEIAGCSPGDGIRAAGTALDIDRIEFAVQQLCLISVPGEIARSLQRFGQAGGIVRFAQFEATGVDSTMDLGQEPPVILINARLAQDSTDAAWITPLIAHDATYLDQPVGTAGTALLARQAEAAICAALFEEFRPSRACDDADALLALEDPLAALIDAGFDE